MVGPRYKNPQPSTLWGMVSTERHWASPTCMMQGRPPTAVHDIHHAGRLGGRGAGHWRFSRNCPFLGCAGVQAPSLTLLPSPISSRPPSDLAFMKIGEKGNRWELGRSWGFGGSWEL